jgi:ABC-type multidrug transport system permease subunit
VINTFKYTVLSILRERSVVIWVLLFPLILATMFNAMFSGLDDAAYDLPIIPVAVVDESQGQAGDAFDATMDALSEGDDALLSATYVDSADDARDLLKSGEAIGVVTLDAEGYPSLELSPGVGDVGVSMEQIKRTVLADVIDDFCRSRAAAEDIAANDPMALANADVVASFSDRSTYTQELAITHSKTKESVRYFYALLGFAALMAAMVGLNAVGRVQPNISPLGARRALSGTSRVRMLVGCISASWVVSFCALMIAFAYIRFVLGVEFGGREGECVFGLAVAALMSTSLGALIGALPGVPFNAKSGILTGLTCLLSLFAGLYGTPAMRLADQIAHDAPWAALVNPAKQVTDLFYSLYVYTDLTPFLQTMGALLVATAVFAFIAGLLMRRQRYASL